MFAVGLLFGIISGGTVGVIIMALCAASKEADKKAKEMLDKVNKM